MSKYNNRVFERDGMKWDSAAEYERYLVLRDKLAQGDITALVVKPTYELHPAYKLYGQRKRQPAITYTPDFEYVQDGVLVTEDVKGVETAVFRIKRKLFEARYGREIVLVRVK